MVSESICLREPLGERHIPADEFPLSIGGAGAGIVLPGLQPGETLARLGLQDGRLFLQKALPPAAGAAANDAAAAGFDAPQWLHDGMRVPLAAATLLALPGDAPVVEVQHDADNRTAPPDIPVPEDDLGADPANVTLSRVAFVPQAAPDAPPAARPRRWLPAAALVVLALLAVAVFVIGSRAIGIRIQTEPADARVRISGGSLRAYVAGRHWVLPGSYRLLATRTGYKPLTQDLSVSDTSPTELRLRLTPAPSLVKLAPLPADAKVFWDERPAANPTQLEAGRHRLRIQAPRHAPYDANVEIKGGGGTEVFAPALVPQWAKVTVLSDPTGARVQVDGQDQGVTPVDLPLDAGLRNIALSHPAAKGWRGSVLVHGGEAQTVGPVRLAAPDARLVVGSTPAGADVTVGGQYRGRTPLQLQLPPGLEYEVAVQRAGFTAVTRRADLRSAPAARVDVKLEPVFGEVSVQGDPADARVFADGRELGGAGQTFKLPAASTQIEVRRTGFDAYKISLTPKPGYPQAVNFTLAAAGTSGQAALPKQLKNSLGMELKLMPLGEFDMGSNRREPGRRSNELQRHVALKRPFYLATQETTNAQFRRFRESHASGVFRSKTLDLDTQPVVNLTWNEAVDFCNWLSAQEGLDPAYVKADDSYKLASPVGSGYRLPTEAEWEFAARHDGRSVTLRYPWGASLPVAPNSGNYADTSARYTLDTIIADYTDGYVVSVAPGKFPANVLGLFDMGGNVAEWVGDWYSAAPLDSGDTQIDPIGPASGKEHVVKGSSFRSSTITELRLAYRDGAADPRVDLGFRVARYAGK